MSLHLQNNSITMITKMRLWPSRPENDSCELTFSRLLQLVLSISILYFSYKSLSIMKYYQVSCSHINNFRFISFLLIFFEKRMVHQFFDCGSIIWIFLKTAVQKITYLCTYNQIRWHFDLIFNYFDQLLLSRYFKRIFTYYHLIHHDTYRPNIDLLVILLSFQDLGTDIEWSATEGSSEFVILVHRPPEIAKFDDILNRSKDTS